MKMKLFLSGSLAALGLWLNAAYHHNVDVASYRSEADTDHLVQVDMAEPEEPVIETAALSQ